MKTILIIFCSLIFRNNLFSQGISSQQKLYYASKVWGFVRYYHSNVSTCGVNWDSVLVGVLPAIITASTDSEFNDAIDTMLAAAGPMSLSTSYFPDTLPAELKRNRNWGWIDSSALLRSDVRAQLDTIRNNFRPHAGCYVEFSDSFLSTPDYGGYLQFPQDQPLLNIDPYLYGDFPDENHRLLFAFKLWNIFNYFNPYNYLIDKPIDTLLLNDIVNFDTASNPNSLFKAVMNITAGLDDAHVQASTYSDTITAFNQYVPAIMLRYLEGKYVVVKSSISALPVGDIILSVNGRTTSQIEDSLSQYISAGNLSVLRRGVCLYGMLDGPYGTAINITYADTTGAIDSTIVHRYYSYLGSWFYSSFYPADSIANIKWTTMGCNIGYINNVALSFTDADNAYAALYNKPAIIVDLRECNDNDEGVDELAYDMTNVPQPLSMQTFPDPTYPGTYYVFRDSVGWPNNILPSYTGTVIVLCNEETESHTETYCTELRALPTHVITVGSQTAGADGAICYFDATENDISVGFTSTGYYYSNGNNVQRIGIVPDSVVLPTIAGIMQGRDEVLEKALQIACSASSIPAISQKSSFVHVFPDPTSGTITVDLENFAIGDIDISVSDVTGKILASQHLLNNSGSLETNFDFHNVPSGLYYIKVESGMQSQNIKFIKL